MCKDIFLPGVLVLALAIPVSAMDSVNRCCWHVSRPATQSEEIEGTASVAMTVGGFVAFLIGLFKHHDALAGSGLAASGSGMLLGWHSVGAFRGRCVPDSDCANLTMYEQSQIKE